MFPLELPSARAVVEPGPALDAARYVVGAMMTPSHARFGVRLSDSCRAHSLPLALFEVPTVHRSISVKGSDDLRYTKASFIRFLLDRFERPILYLDVDCVVAQHPARINDLLADRVDFAIFNWLAEEHTEAYVRAEVTVQDGPARRRVTSDRFYRFSHSIDSFCDRQLLCSGAVQWWNRTPAAIALLEQWQRVIERSPGSADDKCLDHAFNNYPSGAVHLRAAWLPKGYARYGWWIYERPFIDHPEIPASANGFVPLDELDGKRRIYTQYLKQPEVAYVFPKDCLIDTQTGTLLRLSNQDWRPVAPFSTPLWL
ncbi:MAG: hypothetical protein ACLP2F_08630 [Steroidobacteraceae bacterium]